MKNRNTLILLGVLTFAITLSAVIGLWYGYLRHSSLINDLMPSIPAEIKQPRVILRGQSLERSIFFDGKGLAGITDIVPNQSGPGQAEELIVVGKAGVAFVKRDGTTNTVIKFLVSDQDSEEYEPRPRDEDYGLVKAIKNDQGHIQGYISEGGLDGLMVIDNTGTIQCRYGGSVEIDSADITVVKEDEWQFAVSYLDNRGIDLLDKNCKKIKHITDGYASSIRTIRMSSAGSVVIAYSDLIGRLSVSNLHGIGVEKYSLPFPLTRFSLCHYPSILGQEYGLTSNDGKFWLFDFNGRPISNFSAPLSNEFYNAKALPVKLKADAPDYLAVITNYKFLRSMLYVYDSQRNLVYQELLGENSYSVATLPSESAETEDILVGTKTKVLRYSVSKTASR